MAGPPLCTSYVFTGGGTGGHLFPGIAVAEQLRQTSVGVRVLFVGSDRPLEAELVREAGFSHEALPAVSPSGHARHPIRFVRHNWNAYRRALGILQRFGPAAVIGCGGFASVPAILAARRLSIPILLLEQNVIPGRATRLFAPLAAQTCLAFDEARRHMPRRAATVTTGNPVRRAIVELSSARSFARGPAERPTLLVLGGSQGATAVNTALINSVAQDPESFRNWRLVHQTGNRDVSRVQVVYERWGLDVVVAPFFDDMQDRLAQADLVVSRAGGTSLAEIACAGLPAILLPYRHATDNHQWHNAEAFRSAGAALICRDAGDEGALAADLEVAMQSLMADAHRRMVMGAAARRLASPNAAREIVRLLHHCTGTAAA